MRTLQTEYLKLPRSDLEPRGQAAIEHARALQVERGRPLEPERDRGPFAPVQLPDGVSFIADGEDAKRGMGLKIAGGIVAAFGLAITGVYFEGQQAEPWMRLGGPAMFILGAAILWHFHQVQVKAEAQPRLTGAYLWPDVLVHHSEQGCRVFPAEAIRAFVHGRVGDDPGRKVLHIEFVNDAGNVDRRVLFERDASESLGAWLDQARRQS